MILVDELTGDDRAVTGSAGLLPSVFFPRVAGRTKAIARWQSTAPRRGKYRFKSLELTTRSPFGLLERRLSIVNPATLTVYPTIGQLGRRWQHIHREASETRRGNRHELSTQQQEYHGLREYRAGDSPRWIHWRTSARIGQPMVKEFEQQHEQDLAILIDPWIPRGKITAEQRDQVELAIKFAATVCYETCRNPGRRVLLGWTGGTAGVRQGPASVKLLHEMLEQLATLRPSPDGSVASLFDMIPPSILREAYLVVVSTRPLNMAEEAEKSIWLSGSALRGLLGRVVLLDASKGDLNDLIKFEKGPARPSSESANGIPKTAETAQVNGTHSSSMPKAEVTR